MLRPPSTILSLHTSYASSSSAWICVSCREKLQWQCRKASSSTAPVEPAKPSTTPQAHPPRPKNVRGQPPALLPLSRLLGVDAPPRPGENPAKDPRPFSERRVAYWQREAHAERKRQIYAQVARPYHLDWARMRYHDGKRFLAPDAPFRADLAKYFPNFQGFTLAYTWGYVDTTKLLRGKVSIVSYTSQTWSAMQVKTFVGRKENPELDTALEELKEDGLQKMFVTYEDDWLKQALVYLCLRWARRKCDQEHGREVRERSLIVMRGVDRDFWEHKLGVVNLQCGYVFLVDHNCKIRWAGTGDATNEERASLVRVARMLVQERKDHEERKKARNQKPVEKRVSEPRPLGAMMMQ